MGNKINQYIQLGIHLSEDLGLQSVTIDFNSTELDSDSDLVKRVAITLLKSMILNKEDVQIQDILNKYDISKPQ